MKNETIGAEEIYLAPEAINAEENLPTQEEHSAQANSEDIVVAAEEKPEKNVRVSEILDLREGNRKVYRMKDGTKQAVFYPEMVHVFNEETQTFDDVEKTFIEEADGRHFVNGKGHFVARFSREQENDELFSIESGMHRVTVSAKKHAKQKNMGVMPKLRRKLADDVAGKDVLTFEDVQAGTDYEYSVTGNGVKENIVVKEKADLYRYAFVLHQENVTAEFDENSKRVAFMSNETGEEVFFIPAPFMVDAAGVVSTAVSYELRKMANGNAVLSITADSNWMNAEERSFPVTIDPQIQLSGSAAMTTYGWSEGKFDTNQTHVVSTADSCKGYNNAKRMYMTVAMPSLPRNPRIKKAELIFTQKESCVADDMPTKIGLYRTKEVLGSDVGLPQHESDLIDFALMQPGADVEYSFDVTSLLDEFIKGEINPLNFVLKAVNEECTCSACAEFYGSTAANEFIPKLVVGYESTYSVNTSYRTHTHSLGRFGQGSIDLQRGNLMFESEDFAWGGNRMPVTIKHLYNSVLCDCQYTTNSAIQLNTADFSSMKIGKGFKLNIMQSMVPASFQHEGEACQGYVFVGENGEETFFKESNAHECCAENGQCYHLYEDVDGSDMVYDHCKHTLKQGDDTYLFDAAGRLIKITDAFGNQLQINYTAGRITSVLDGAGRDFNFAYNADGFLNTITAPDGQATISFTYTENLLTDITYQDGTKAKITYGADNKPVCVTLADAVGNDVYKVVYAYAGDRLSRVTECGVTDGAFVQGATSEYSYSIASGRTVVKTTELTETEEGECCNNVIKTVYTFDEEGNVVSEYVYSQDSGNVGAEGEASGINPHSGDGGVGVVSNINNLLKGHNFERLADWGMMPGNEEKFWIDNYDSAEARTKFGAKLLLMRSYHTDSVENGVFQQTNMLPAGQYTFSAYMRAIANFNGGNNLGGYIRVVTMDGTVLAESEHIVMADPEYIRLIAPFEIPCAQSVQVQILLNGMGWIYVDAAQLENNPYANAYNMLENGNFEDIEYVGDFEWIKAWEYLTGVAYGDSTCFNMQHSMKIEGNLDEIREAHQDVAVKKSADTRETFVLSGWAKGYGIANHEREGLNTPKFELRAEIAYKDGSTESHIAEFCSRTDEWQLASVEFAKEKYQAVEKIRVYCDYSYNFGHAYFDDIQLVRKSIETGLSDSDFDNGSSADDVDAEDIENTEIVEDTAPAFEEHRDAYGNALTETTFTDGEFGTIYRAFKFNEDDNCLEGNDAGNNLIMETDARGYQTKYVVDCETSRNTEVIDRCGNKTTYEYDAAGRTTKVTSKDSSNNELANVAYAYDAFDNMTQIVRGDGMKYVLAYNEFHNLESIGVDGKAEKLVEYGYKAGNGRLKSITYANGDQMNATYNSIGQMVAEKWFDKNGTLTAHYKYTYDGQGNIVRSIDMLAQKEYNYEYEDGRIVRATEASIAFSGEMVVSKTLINSIRYFYDAEGTMTRKVIAPVGGETQTVYYETTDDNTVVKFNAGGKTVTSHSKTDSFGRKVFDELQLGTGFVSRQFAYYAGAVTDEHEESGKLKSTPTTQLVSRITFADGRTLDYEYDAEERITKVTDSVDGVTEYTYDALGQLLTETVNDTLVNVMTYDDYGNILTKNGVAYTYSDGAWKDLLVSYNGQTITYDAQGNPLTYLGHTLTWEKGRQLKSFDSNTYTYNANGIRTSKTVAGVKHDYILDGTKILREEWCGNILTPIYDNEDSVCGIIYNGEPYYFLKTLQGDVIAIVDKNAKTVAQYSYDAWGVCTSAVTHTEQTGGVDIANINPFRYRSYYFDKEIETYYLQSRYYDPVVGRFINADETSYNGPVEKTHFLCLFAYCENDPSNKEDYAGRATVFVAGYGLQIEISGKRGVFGVEFVWYIVSSIRKGRAWYIPYIYLYGGASLNSDFTSAINKLATNPTLMLAPKKIGRFSGSISAFAIFGYTGKFTRPQDYEGLFSGVSATIWNVKAYSAFSGTCFSVGVGISTSKFAASSGGTWYFLSSAIYSNLKNLYNNVANKASKIKG